MKTPAQQDQVVPPPMLVQAKRHLPSLADAVVDARWHRLVTVTRGLQPKLATRFRVMLVPGCLAVDFVAEADTLRTCATLRNDPVYSGDCLEVFLQQRAVSSERPHEGQRYLELEISPAGVLFDAWVTNRTDSSDTAAKRDLELEFNVAGPNRPRGTVLLDGESPEAHSQSSFAAGVEAREWRARLEIPLTGFGLDATDLEDCSSLWRANVFRVHGREPAREYSAWCPTGLIDFHRPDRFGEWVIDANS